MKNKIKQYLALVSATFFMAVSVVVFFEAMGVVVGGVSGIAIILKNLFEIPMWLVSVFINVPLFIIAYKFLEKDIFIRTLFATICLTIFLGIIPEWKILTGDMLVDIIIAGVLMGTGLGIVFSTHSSSGGTDLLATLINMKIRQLSIPKILAIIDAIIVMLGATVFGISRGIYAIIAIYTMTKVSDAIIEGPNRAKLIYILTKRHEELADFIVNDINRGATYINVTGAFTNNCQKMLMCVVSSKEIVKIKQKVYKIDERAICFIGDIREAFGEGFTKYRG